MSLVVRLRCAAWLRIILMNMPEIKLLWPDNLDEVMKKADALPKHPVIIEAYWDGDSDGWMAIVSAIVEEPSQQHPQYKEYNLAGLRGSGGNMRLFNNQVPPWLESQNAIELGKILSEKFDVPFYFPCSDWPDDDCARWWEQDKAKPCEQCGKLIVQADFVHYHGICYQCFLKREKNKRETTE